MDTHLTTVSTSTPFTIAAHGKRPWKPLWTSKSLSNAFHSPFVTYQLWLRQTSTDYYERVPFTSNLKYGFDAKETADEVGHWERERKRRLNGW